MGEFTPPVARATMLIRRPIDEVFNAFIDPAVTTKFWYSRASAPLKTGDTVTWHWDYHEVSVEVAVKVLEPNRRIQIEWPTPVEWLFTQVETGTFVEISAYGFTGSMDEIVSQALDSTEGFNLVISACKALLEHGIELNVVKDKDRSAGRVQ